MFSDTCLQLNLSYPRDMLNQHAINKTRAAMISKHCARSCGNPKKERDKGNNQEIAKTFLMKCTNQITWPFQVPAYVVALDHQHWGSWGSVLGQVHDEGFRLDWLNWTLDDPFAEEAPSVGHHTEEHCCLIVHEERLAFEEVPFGGDQGSLSGDRETCGHWQGRG